MKLPFDVKKIGIKNMILLLVSGVMILILTVPDLLSSFGQESVPVTSAPEPVPTQTVIEAQQEKTEEERLKEVLSKIAGVGKTEVMIAYKTTEENVVLKDGEETVLTVNGNREENPYLIKKNAAVISGVLVVAEGAENGMTAIYISDAVEALFDIEKHKIIVLPME